MTTVRSNDTLVDTPFCGFFHVNKVFSFVSMRASFSRGALEGGGGGGGNRLAKI